MKRCVTSYARFLPPLAGATRRVRNLLRTDQIQQMVRNKLHTLRVCTRPWDRSETVRNKLPTLRLRWRSAILGRVPACAGTR